jgi:hypothetical protein
MMPVITYLANSSVPNAYRVDGIPRRSVAHCGPKGIVLGVSAGSTTGCSLVQTTLRRTETARLVLAESRPLLAAGLGDDGIEHLHDEALLRARQLLDALDLLLQLRCGGPAWPVWCPVYRSVHPATRRASQRSAAGVRPGRGLARIFWPSVYAVVMAVVLASVHLAVACGRGDCL